MLYNSLNYNKVLLGLSTYLMTYNNKTIFFLGHWLFLVVFIHLYYLSVTLTPSAMIA